MAAMPVIPVMPAKYTVAKYTAVTTILFAISFVSGYMYAVLNPAEATEITQELTAGFEWITELHPLAIMLAIFLNNAVKSLIVILLGVFIVIPIGFIVFNGYILGIVAYEYGRTMGHGYVAAAIIPHGIIELPMIFMSAALGTHLGVMGFSRLRGNISSGAILSELRRSVSFYFRWILPLLFVASAIETFVTPIVLYLLGWA